ncbi:hypothetical protein E5329_18575 [Petralouisia muris]|uniref:Uncharacterized protein n=1 Tax=Petralouisia muris TaxID=3032872 RepID=A0AC61RTC8_9FIRM|nr:phage terminase small subunit [Petralouisia muris]TGY93425.1 hypothetical protein E5329_18575 [Petralouisia muris]
MPRKKDEKREKAKQIFLDSNGLAKNPEIAKALGVDSAKIAKWKCMDKWKEELENKPKKQGAQKGNQNAKGHGAPKRNRNAQTHGAYSTVYFDELTEEEKKLIESVTLDTSENMLRELQTLIAKENDLKKRIAELNSNNTGELFVDRVVEMRTPKKAEDSDPYGTYTGEATEGSSKPPLDVAMETTIKSSAFERAMKLEAELNKIHGRIIKLLDSIKSYELEQRRISLEERRYALMKQKVSGVYDVDPDTGEIDDTYIENEEQEGVEE